MKVKCIDDKNKPAIIPDDLFVKEGESYTLIHIYKQVNQNNILGAVLKELDISAYIPYNCFRLDRFAYRIEDLPELEKMMRESAELNDADISELLEILEFAPEEEFI